jgi:hypothetical protein
VLLAWVQAPHLIEGLQSEFRQILRQLADFQIARLVFVKVNGSACTQVWNYGFCVFVRR